MNWRRALYVAAALLIAAGWQSFCHDPSVRADERKRLGDEIADAKIQQRDSLQFAWLADWNKQMAKYQQKLDAARAAVRPRRTIVLTDTVLVAQQFDARDTLQARTDSSLRATENARRFWHAQARTAYDSIIPSLQQARDSWRAIASKPSHTVTDLLGGAALGYALAKDSKVAAGVGGALILLPRAFDVLGRLF